MGASENKQKMQKIFSAMAQGDPSLFVESLADNIQWKIIGTTPFSRIFNGKQAVLTELMGPLGEQIEGRIKIIGDRFIADDDFVVVEARGDNLTKSGKPYNNTYCWVSRFENGKIAELVEYMDTALVLSTFGR